MVRYSVHKHVIAQCGVYVPTTRLVAQDEYASVIIYKTKSQSVTQYRT